MFLRFCVSERAMKQAPDVADWLGGCSKVAVLESCWPTNCRRHLQCPGSETGNSRSMGHPPVVWALEPDLHVNVASEVYSNCVIYHF